MVSLPGVKNRDNRLHLGRVSMLVLAVLMCSAGLDAYSVLTHEEIVDLLWTDGIRPLLLKHYPESSEEQLNEAHAYAYGGAIIQDLGYYPFGSSEFSRACSVASGPFPNSRGCAIGRPPTTDGRR